MGRGARPVRRAGRGQPLLRDVLVPAHRPPADQAQQPHPRPARAAVTPQGVVGRRVPLQPRLRLDEPPRQPQPEAGPQDQRHLRSGADRAPLLRRAAQGVHLAAAGGVPGDGVRRPARGGPRRAPGGARHHRRERLDDQLPDRGPGLPRRRRAPVDGVRAPLGLPRLPHERPDRPHRLLPRHRAAAVPLRRPSPLGQAAHPHRGRPRSGVPALGRRPGPPRASRPRPASSPTPTSTGSSAPDRRAPGSLRSGMRMWPEGAVGLSAAP